MSTKVKNLSLASFICQEESIRPCGYEDGCYIFNEEINVKEWYVKYLKSNMKIYDDLVRDLRLLSKIQ